MQNEVDSHSGKYINRAFDFYIISMLPGQTMVFIVFQIMAKPHTNGNIISDCCFILINMSPINSKTVSRDSTGGKYFQTLFLNYTRSTYSVIFMVG